MKITITGADSVDHSVALELLNHDHECALTDNQPDKLRVASVADVDWVPTDACSPDTPTDAGPAQIDVMVTATDDDKTNLVISLLAKTGFAIPRVVAHLNNPEDEQLFDVSWGMGASVSTPHVMTALVDEAVSVDIPVHLFSFNSAEISVYAIVLPEESPLVDHRIVEVDLPPCTVLTSLLRLGRPITPSDNDIFEAGDELLLLISGLEENALDTLTRLVEVSGPEVNEGAEEQA